MKYRSVVPLNSAPDVVRLRQYAMTREAMDFFLDMGIMPDDTMAFVALQIENRMKLMNEDQRRATLAKLNSFKMLRALV